VTRLKRDCHGAPSGAVCSFAKMRSTPLCRLVLAMACATPALPIATARADVAPGFAANDLYDADAFARVHATRFLL